jgi:hypothetical protein
LIGGKGGGVGNYGRASIFGGTSRYGGNRGEGSKFLIRPLGLRPKSQGFGWRFGQHLSELRPHLFHGEPPDQEKNADWNDPGKKTAQEFTLIVSGVIDLVCIQVLYQVGINHPNRGELLARLFFKALDENQAK